MPTTITIQELAQSLLNAHQAENLPDEIVQQAYERCTYGRDLLNESLRGEFTPLIAATDAILECLQSDLNLDAVNHAQIGNLSLSINFSHANISFTEELDHVIHIINAIPGHVMACYDNDQASMRKGWANPWTIGIASGSDDVDYIGSYPQVIADLLIIYRAMR